MPSIVVENRVNRSFRYRDYQIRKHFGISLLDFQAELDRAIASFIYWNYLALLKKPDLSYRIEDQSELLASYLIENRLSSSLDVTLNTEPQNTANSHFSIGKKSLSDDDLYKLDLKVFQKPNIGVGAWRKCDIELVKLLNGFCKCYGYDVPDFIAKILNDG